MAATFALQAASRLRSKIQVSKFFTVKVCYTNTCEQVLFTLVFFLPSSQGGD